MCNAKENKWEKYEKKNGGIYVGGWGLAFRTMETYDKNANRHLCGRMGVWHSLTPNSNSPSAFWCGSGGFTPFSVLGDCGYIANIAKLTNNIKITAETRSWPKK